MDPVSAAIAILSKDTRFPKLLEFGDFDYIVLEWNERTCQLDIENKQNNRYEVTVNYIPTATEIINIEHYDNLSLADTISHIRLRQDIIKNLQAEFLKNSTLPLFIPC